MIALCYVQGGNPQLNLLTDRIMLDRMNNCNAGWESITLASDGKFYVCPAFYLEGEEAAIGDLKKVLTSRMHNFIVWIMLLCAVSVMLISVNVVFI